MGYIIMIGIAQVLQLLSYKCVYTFAGEGQENNSAFMTLNKLLSALLCVHFYPSACLIAFHIYFILEHDSAFSRWLSWMCYGDRSWQFVKSEVLEFNEERRKPSSACNPLVIKRKTGRWKDISKSCSLDF